MKIKASTIMSALGILRSIDTTAMKLSVSYKVKKVLNECEAAISGFEAKRKELAAEHGELNEEETHYLFEAEGSEKAFQDALQEMLDDEVDIMINKIPLDLIDEYVTVEPANIELVSWFIDGLED